MDGVGEKAPPPSVSVGLRGSKKMCRFGVSGVAPVPLNTSEPQVTPGVCRGALAAGAGAGSALGSEVGSKEGSAAGAGAAKNAAAAPPGAGSADLKGILVGAGSR